MNNYLREFKRLNTAQRQAVEHISGPLLVVAGPGTGKTQLLSTRVAHILHKTDSDANNILCLTFTNKAAENMRRRVLEQIGPTASGVAVKTFHGLAADIMNRYPEYFWRGAHLSIAPEAVQLQIMQRVLSSLPAEHPLALKFAGQFSLIDDVAKSINLAKEAGLTPAKLRAIISANIAYIEQIEPLISKLGNLKVGKKTLTQIDDIVGQLPLQPIDELIAPLQSLQRVITSSYNAAQIKSEENGKTTSISKWKSRWLQNSDGIYGMHDERRRNDWWLAVADAYTKYRQQMHRRGYYDYADMLVETISQIEKHGDLRASLQEQFQYVLIDEFQDTNAAQLRLAHMIADHPELDNPNIMVVGDDDQSIFKFQGAELSNMLGFSHQYSNAKIIVLTDNYRSTQAILDTADKIISHSQYRLVGRLPGLSKKLKAASESSTKSLISHRAYRSREEHLSELANTAGDLLNKGNSVAILARRHASLRDMAMILHQNGTPIAYEQSNNILDQPAIEQLFLILKIVVHIKKGESGQVNELLSLTLRHPMWGIDSKILWRFAIRQQTKYDWLSGAKESKHHPLANAGKWLDWLCNVSASEPLAVVIEYVLGLRDSEQGRSPMRNYFFASKNMSESYLQALSAIQLLRLLVAEFRSAGIAKTEDFVSYIDLMIASGKVISDSSPFVSGEHRVELLSVHKAKGLEFDAVIVIDAVADEWKPQLRGRLPPANLPLRPAEEDDDDYVRLMYVAATRAKHTLIFGSFKTNPTGDEGLPPIMLSQLPAEIIKSKSSTKLVEVLERALAWPRLEQADEAALLRPRLADYTMNVSNLINFLDVTKGGPEYFKQRNLLRLPSAKTPPAAMGSAVHSALEHAQLLINSGDFSLPAVIGKFGEALLAEGLPETDYRKKLADGNRAITRFINEYEWQFVTGAHPEYKIVDVMNGDARLGGTLDVLDTTNEQTIITDYKTGQPLNSFGYKSGANGLKAWRHKLQLVFYALLVELDPAIHPKGELIAKMVYIESSDKSKLTLPYKPTKPEIDRLKRLVSAVWARVQALDFVPVGKYSKDAGGIANFENDLIEGKI